jgi:hypothetical protein
MKRRWIFIVIIGVILAAILIYSTTRKDTTVMVTAKAVKGSLM